MKPFVNFVHRRCWLLLASHRQGWNITQWECVLWSEGSIFFIGRKWPHVLQTKDKRLVETVISNKSSVMEQVFFVLAASAVIANFARVHVDVVPLLVSMLDYAGSCMSLSQTPFNWLVLLAFLWELKCKIKCYKCF